MQTLLPETRTTTDATAGDSTFLRLLVRNHPGVMSHIAGLFARRGFNVDGILCLPVGDRTCSVILLVVADDQRLEQLIRQLDKLEDVIEIRRAPEARQAFAVAAPLLAN
ncbi:MAG TPA: acetolactate synthase small subunit [Candidatus Binatia bacterium]|nr:acetolactate synthase small subunit [Candidatus Binatia bacterium]